ncbi:YjbH domain-containing protein [Thalassotalea aquiviva]|uniref:YjbH domain-containing protein n=1 Tax=Thalassotalea aquiviva TaxID=3242415 RepID=UPI00352A095B
MKKAIYILSLVSASALLPFSLVAEEQADNDEKALGALSFLSSSGNVTNSFSMQGYTGVFNTPTTQVVDYGNFEFSYSNNFFDQGAKFEKSEGFLKADDLKFSVGILPNIEVVGRLATKYWSMNQFYDENRKDFGFRDLSGSVKWKLPYIPEDWFLVSVGGQDVGGSVVKSEVYYINASKEFSLNDFGSLRTTIGLATSDNAIGYMDGVFGSFEYQPVDYLQLSAEYDANAVNVGVKAFTPDSWLPEGWKVSLSAQLYSSNKEHNEKDKWWSVGIQIPLGDEPRERYKNSFTHNENTSLNETIKEPRSLNPDLPKKQGLAHGSKKIEAQTAKPTNEQLIELSSILTKYGFESVSIGTNPFGYVVIQFENNLYNRNENQALLKVSELVNAHLGDLAQNAILELTNQGVVVYRQHVGANTAKNLNSNSALFKNQYFSNVDWVTNNESSAHFTPRLILSPGLSTLVGTEYGAFDYQVVLSSNLQMSLWDGAVLDIRHMSDTLVNTGDLEDNKYIYKRFGIKEGVDRRLIHQTVSLPFNVFTKLSYGRIYGNADGWLNETRWASPNNTHRFSVLTGDFENQDIVLWGGKKFYHKPSLFKYRYRYEPLNWDVELTAGEYWQGDKGFTLRSLHWFGDVQVGIRYRKTKFDDRFGGEEEDFLALGFSIPLTLGKSMKSNYGFQVRGIEQFNYYVETSLTEKNTGNHIKTGFGQEPLLYHNLNQSYFNRDRN